MLTGRKNESFSSLYRDRSIAQRAICLFMILLCCLPNLFAGQNSQGGFVAAAFEASERSRARSFLELLAEGDIRSGADAKLIERERGLQQQINDKSVELIRLKIGKHTDDQLEQLKKD